MDTSALFDISGKVALVTGATAGIGRMIAEGLVQAGAKVWICSRKPADVAATAADLSRLGECHGVVADVGSEAGIAALVDAMAAAGRLDILINNAGTSFERKIGELERDRFTHVLDLNLVAPFMLVQALLPLLRTAATPEAPARIINIASLNGMRAADRHNYPYSTSKAGMLMLTEHLARMLAPDNIIANAVSPGFFPSRLTGAELDNPEFRRKVASPLGGRVGEPEDIIGTIIYLCSRASAWVTGWNIPLGGGRKVIDS